MVSFYNELPLTSLTYTPNSARIAVTYLSQALGVRGTERSFFVNSIPQPRVDTLEVCLSEKQLPQFPMVSMNKSRLIAPLDVTYNDSRYDYIYTQLLGATHNYQALQRAFRRWTISTLLLHKPFPLRSRKTSLAIYSSFVSKIKQRRRIYQKFKIKFGFRFRTKRRPFFTRAIKQGVSRTRFPLMIPKYFSNTHSLIFPKWKNHRRVSYLQGPMVVYKGQKSITHPLFKPPYLKSLLLNLFYDYPEDIYRSWTTHEHRLQYVSIRLINRVSTLFYPRVQQNKYTSFMAKFAFSFVRKGYWCDTGPFHLYKLSKHDVTPRLYKVFSNRVLAYKTITPRRRSFFGHLTNLIHPDSKLFASHRLNSLLKYEPFFDIIVDKIPPYKDKR